MRLCNRPKAVRPVRRHGSAVCKSVSKGTARPAGYRPVGVPGNASISSETGPY